MIRKLQITLFIIFLAAPAFSQRWKLKRMEAYFGVGSTQVFGDIGGTASASNWFGLKDIKFDETKPAFTLGARYKINPHYSLRLNLGLGFGSGSDIGAKNESRGFSYKTTVFESTILGEYYFLQEERHRQSAAMYNRRGMINYYSTISAYAFLGTGPVFYSPKFNGIPRGENIDQVTGYSKVGLAFPVGIGLKYLIDENWQFGAELGSRFTTTDFIDGYKNLQYSKHPDMYYFLILSLNFRIETSRKGLPLFLDKKYRKIRR
jgi:opacity protein-like surface antigen